MVVAVISSPPKMDVPASPPAPQVPKKKFSPANEGVDHPTRHSKTTINRISPPPNCSRSASQQALDMIADHTINNTLRKLVTDHAYLSRIYCR
jgi:hypothetical protein